MALQLLLLPRDESLLWPTERELLASANQLIHLNPKHPSFAWAKAQNPNLKPAEGAQLQAETILLSPMSALDEARRLVDRLLGPGGCPWDQQQTHESLKRFLIEESYELLDAIDQQSQAAIIEELGDVLLQPLLHAQIAAKDGRFSTDEVAFGLIDKLVRRHPHVFGEVVAETSDQVLSNWDAIKKAEKGEATSILDGVPTAMPSLLRAFEISKRAARAGFEWPNLEGVYDKLHEELEELAAALKTGDVQEIESEIGDLLFTIVNVARWVKVEPEEALRQMVTRFSARFKAMQAAAKIPLDELSSAQWDELWNEAKVATRKGVP